MAPESNPLDINWCRLTDPPCPYSNLTSDGKDSNCGIDRWLRQIESPSARLQEANRLENMAQQDPDRLHELCARGVFEY